MNFNISGNINISNKVSDTEQAHIVMSNGKVNVSATDITLTATNINLNGNMSVSGNANFVNGVNVSGTATFVNGVDNVKINTNTDKTVTYQVPFVNSDDNKSNLFIDNTGTFTYNANTNTLKVPTLIASNISASEHYHAADHAEDIDFRFSANTIRTIEFDNIDNISSNWLRIYIYYRISGSKTLCYEKTVNLKYLSDLSTYGDKLYIPIYLYDNATEGTPTLLELDLDSNNPSKLKYSLISDSSSVFDLIFAFYFYLF
jgi:hypothetical protein